MRILILSFYFPPDLSAGSFRTKALVDALMERGGADLHIDVITTMPNRYQSLSNAASEEETNCNLTIRRISLPSHQSGMADQARAFLHFARQARSLVRGENWDLVYGTSSRLMTAVLSAGLAKRVKAPLYLDIRDLFTDTMANILAGQMSRLLLPFFRGLERRTFRSATRINLVSPGFVDHVRRVSGKQDLSLFTNGIDDEFLNLGWSPARAPASSPLILYAGNIGEGQGLHNILPDAARLLEGKARLRIVGDGGRRKQLEAALSAATSDTVELLDPVPRLQLLGYYQTADILFLHLNDYDAFRKVLPSKLFEYAATGKPILAGVAGYAADFIRSEIEGAEVFEPCDAQGMRGALKRLQQQPAAFSRQAFLERYARRNIMRRMADEILELARRTHYAQEITSGALSAQ